jgi:protein-disulfide isomerase
MEPETPQGDQMDQSELEPDAIVDRPEAVAPSEIAEPAGEPAEGVERAVTVEQAAAVGATQDAHASDDLSAPTEPRPDPSVELEPVPVAPVHPVTPPGSGSPLRILGYLLAAVAGIALTLAVLVGSGSVTMGTPEPTASPTPAPTFAMDGPSMGIASAPVTIEIWADFQCPYCGLVAHGVEPSLIREYAATGKARIDYRDFAFLGQESVDAAVAAQCAGREGLFWRYHDLLFASQSGENQGAFSRDRLVALAKFAGIADATAFTACLDDAAVAQGVTAETEEGRGYGVDSTPTIRITGPGPTQFLKGVSDPATIAAAVEKASTPAPSGSPAAGASSSPEAGGSASPASPSPTP